MVSQSRRAVLERLFMVLALLYCLVLILGVCGIGFHLLTTPLEVAIFVTGAAAVWLAVKEHILNWPVGIVNVVLWIVLFLQQKLFANAVLQIVYIVTGFLGWYWWLHGTEGKTALPISRASLRLTLALAVAVLTLSYPTMMLLDRVGGNATFWDALTTLLSLAGQYFLMRKHLENWYFWIVADVIYIGLFLSQKLYLSAQLYVLFLIMCFFGVAQWKATLRGSTAGGVQESEADNLDLARGIDSPI